MTTTRTTPKTIKLASTPGFTLIEILMAITILAIILSMAYTILISTLNARDWIQAHTEIGRVGSRLINLISNDLQAAYIYQLQGNCFLAEKDRYGSRVNFVTNTDSMVFVKDIRSDLCEVGYFMRENPKERGLHVLMRREDFFLDSDMTGGGKALRLYDRVLDFQLKFYGDKGVNKEIWNNTRDKGLPRIVEVKLTLTTAPPGTPRSLLAKNKQVFLTYVPILASANPEVTVKKEEKK